ncbi:hypothetical protein RSAG8_10377, partial [Rhizoctonia solani AG-8 WAC10335]
MLHGMTMCYLRATRAKDNSRPWPASYSFWRFLSM